MVTITERVYGNGSRTTTYGNVASVTETGEYVSAWIHASGKALLPHGLFAWTDDTTPEYAEQVARTAHRRAEEYADSLA